MRKSGTIQRHSSLLCNQKQKAKRHDLCLQREKETSKKTEKEEIQIIARKFW